MLSIGSQPRSGNNSASHSRSASANGIGRRSGEITIQEEDEEAEAEAEAEEAMSGDAGAEDDVEEVDQFSPIMQIPGEKIEEIYENPAQEPSKP